jgi:AcrR family transcriptional regulator
MRQTKGQQTRTLLLEAALQQFAANGYHGTSMRQIADAAGVAVGGIYNHFSSKEEILTAVILAWHPLNVLVPALIEGSDAKSLEAFIRSVAQQCMNSLDERPALLRILLIELFEFDGAHLPLLFERLWPNATLLMQRLVALDERLRPLSPLTFVRLFLGALIGFYISGALLSKLPAPHGTQIGTLDDLVTVLVHGLLTANE